MNWLNGHLWEISDEAERLLPCRGFIRLFLPLFLFMTFFFSFLVLKLLCAVVETSWFSCLAAPGLWASRSDWLFPG